MVKKAWLYILLVIILSSCANISGEADFLKTINTIEYSINESEWEGLKQQAQDLKELYKKSKWKIQLVGDEGEYEKLYGSINRLIVTIEEEDKIQAKLELAVVRTFIEDIYSL